MGQLEIISTKNYHLIRFSFVFSSKLIVSPGNKAVDGTSYVHDCEFIDVRMLQTLCDLC